MRLARDEIRNKWPGIRLESGNLRLALEDRVEPRENGVATGLESSICFGDGGGLVERREQRFDASGLQPHPTATVNMGDQRGDRPALAARQRRRPGLGRNPLKKVEMDAVMNGKRAQNSIGG